MLHRLFGKSSIGRGTQIIGAHGSSVLERQTLDRVGSSSIPFAAV